MFYENTPTFIAVGNRFRGDDGVGYEIIERLRTRKIPGAEFIESTGEGAALMEILNKKPLVFLFDAVCSGAQAGTIFHFEAHRESLPSKFFNYSTHAFSVAEAIEMARALNQLPARLIVFGIEGENFAAGAGLSEKVEEAIEKVVSNVLMELE